MKTHKVRLAVAGLCLWTGGAMVSAGREPPPPPPGAEGEATVRLGPFEIRGARTEQDGDETRGTATLHVRGVGEFNLKFVLQKERLVTGSWEGRVAIPGIGESAWKGQISPKGLEARRDLDVYGQKVATELLITPAGLTASGAATIRLGPYTFPKVRIVFAPKAPQIEGAASARIALGPLGRAQVSLQMRDGGFCAEGQGAVKLGRFAFPNARIRVSNKGEIVLAGQSNVNLAGVGQVEMSLQGDARQATARGQTTVKLGSFSCGQCAVTLDSRGHVTLAPSGAVNVPGVGGVNLALTYDNGKIAAHGTTTARLGNFAFTNAGVEISNSGAVSISGSQSLNVPGLGNVSLTLACANGALTASGTTTAHLGNLAFTNAQVQVSGNGTATVSGNQSLNVPGLGNVNLTLAYANGALTASGTTTAHLGNYSFTNAQVQVSSNGTATVSGSQSLNVPGLGNVSLTLAYANGALTASGTTTAHLGTYAFSDTAVTVSSQGAVTVSKTQSVNLPGAGSASLALAFANGKLSAAGATDLHLGSYLFSNVQVGLNEAGTLTLSGSSSVNLPVLGSRTFAVGVVNGVPAATWSGSTSIAGANRNVDAIIAANGQARLHINTDVKIGDWLLWASGSDVNLDANGLSATLNVCGQSLTVRAGANGNISGTASGGLSIGGIPIANGALTASNAGITGTGAIGTGNLSIAGATFTAKANGSISGTGNVSLGGNQVAATFSLGAGGNSVSGSLARNASFRGVAAKWYYNATASLGISGSNLTMSSSGGITRYQLVPKSLTDWSLVERFPLNCGSYTGAVNLASGEVTVHVSAAGGFAAADVTFDLW